MGRVDWLRVSLCLIAAFIASPVRAEERGAGGGPVRLHELQFIGTHNSYHIAPDAAVFARMKETRYRESAKWTAERLVAALSFTHRPLREQLDRGLRLFELDVHDDPDGGRYADPGFLKALAPEVAATLSPVDPLGELKLPGFKVFHTADTDVRSRCLRFIRCLEEIRAWSDANPGHMPVFIQLESKEGRKPPLANAYRQAERADFDRQSWARLHGEILQVFPQERLFLPRELKGDHASVNAAVRAGGWPLASELAGRIVFLLLDDPRPQDAYAALTTTGGEEPLLFVSRGVDDPETAWLIRPKPDRKTIRPLVRQGFLVYTRADADSVEPRRRDLSRAREAIDSGAQLISTDYPWPASAFGDYAVSFGGAHVRCNVIIRADACRADQPAAK